MSRYANQDGVVGFVGLTLLKAHAEDDHDSFGAQAGYEAMSDVVDIALQALAVHERGHLPTRPLIRPRRDNVVPLRALTQCAPRTSQTQGAHQPQNHGEQITP